MQRSVFDLRRFEEPLRDLLLIGGEEVDCDRAALLDGRVHQAVSLDADHHERRMERALREPRESRSGGRAFLDRGHHVHPVGNLSQDFSSRVFVHAFASFRA